MSNPIHLLDVVALTENLPEHGLQTGQVGTVVEELDSGVFEVEFSDDTGRAYALLPLREDQILVLHFEKTHAA
jgi:membrane protein implicated in regulation of membrane protease activity